MRAITKSSGGKLSPWNIPFFIFTVPRDSAPTTSFVSQFLILVPNKAFILYTILNISSVLTIQEWRAIIGLLVVNPARSTPSLFPLAVTYNHLIY